MLIHTKSIKMKKLLYPLLFSFGLILTACPYESDIELNTYEDSLKIDKKLLGEWVAFHGDGSREELILTKIARSVIDATHKRFSANNKFDGRFKYRAYTTEFNGITIFNIENTEGKYLFAKYAWTGKNEFYIQAVSADYVVNNFKVDSVTTTNLRAFMMNNVNKEKLYEDKIEFYRKGSPEYNKVRMYMKKSGF